MIDFFRGGRENVETENVIILKNNEVFLEDKRVIIGQTPSITLKNREQMYTKLYNICV